MAIAVGDNFFVVVSHINSPSDFYVRRFKHQNIVTSTSAWIAENLKCDPSLLKTVMFEDIPRYSRSHTLVYFNDHDQIYYRIIPLSKCERTELYNVLLQDVGRTEKVEFADLKVLDMRVFPLIDDDNFIIRCELNKCVPVEPNWTETAIETMRTTATDRPLRLTVLERGRLKVRCDLFRDYIDIGMEMCLLGHARIAPPIQPIERLDYSPTLQYFKPQALRQGSHENVVITTFTDATLFTATKTNLIPHLIEVTDALNDAYADSQPGQSDFVIRNACVACFLSGKWLRAVVVNVYPHRGEATVYLIDLGITSKRIFDYLRPLRVEFMASEALATKCKIFPDNTFSVSEIMDIKTQLLSERLKGKIMPNKTPEDIHEILPVYLNLNNQMS